MSEYDWNPVVPLRWSAAGKLQQQFKRRVSNDRGIWYDEFEWRDVPRQPVDEIPLVKYPAQETHLGRNGVDGTMPNDHHDNIVMDGRPETREEPLCNHEGMQLVNADGVCLVCGESV